MSNTLPGSPSATPKGGSSPPAIVGFKPTEPKNGGIVQNPEGKWDVWTGRKPKDDWTLQPLHFMSCLTNFVLMRSGPKRHALLDSNLSNLISYSAALSFNVCIENHLWLLAEIWMALAGRSLEKSAAHETAMKHSTGLSVFTQYTANRENTALLWGKTDTFMVYFCWLLVCKAWSGPAGVTFVHLFCCGGAHKKTKKHSQHLSIDPSGSKWECIMLPWG
jgi:hypothetical protein